MKIRYLGLLVLLTACTEESTAPFQAQLSAVSNSPMAIVETVGDPDQIAQDYGLTPKFVYRHALNGFAAPVSELARAGLMKDMRVKRVADDEVMQVDETWGLDRIDQRTLPLDNAFTPPNTGEGVSVYILDTGIVPTLGDFEGRASIGADVTGGNGIDCQGHGTHVAGTVGSKTYGVAKKTNLVAVKIFADCTTSTPVSTIVAGLDWVIANAQHPAVANMSLGGGASAAMDAAVESAVASGIVVAVSAGNSNTDACSQSPARTPNAITVGATTSTDARSSFSNYGVCVDIFAPGTGIYSLSRTGTALVLSGTSMASPHVAGAAALIRQADPTLTPAQVADLLAARSTKYAVIDPQFDGDLLYVLTDEMPRPPGARPVAGYSRECVFTTCDFTDQSAGDPVAWNWSFGSTEQNPTHKFNQGYDRDSSPRGYSTVTLTVTNVNGLSSSVSQSFALVSPIDMSLALIKVKGTPTAKLSWTGARGDSLLILRQRQGQVPPFMQWTVPNTGSWTDTSLPKGKLSTTVYSMCERSVEFADYQCNVGLIL